MIVLGIETSCDETSAAVVRAPGEVLSNVVFTQQEMHGPFGGVVPEIASRSHLEKLPEVVEQAREESGLTWGDIDAIAVTYGPGLASSLLIGMSGAKGLAMRLGIPLIPVNHLHGHIFSAFLSPGSPSIAEACPFIALVVSGGHTSLVEVKDPQTVRLLGQTIDDAAGEAFDKGASLLGLGYPGGPLMDRIAKDGNASAVKFPRTQLSADSLKHYPHLDPELSFSYSGLKTSLMYHVKKHPEARDDEAQRRDVVASYQEAIVDALVSRCVHAMDGQTTLAMGGGVSLNSRLRARLKEEAAARGWQLLLTKPRFCADNAAMITFVAAQGLASVAKGGDALKIDVMPSLSIVIGSARC